GIETLHEMKKMEDNKSINAPCIALTANAINGAKQQYLEAGFDDYVSKPVSGLQLEEIILRYLPEEMVERYVITDDYLNNGTLTCSLLENKINTLSEGLMDGAKAIENCGSEETLIKILKDFKLSIREKSRQILKFAEEGNYKDYTVLVHALKSSARLIGAMSISEEAAYLERCGDELNIDEINNRTGSLIYKYRSLEGVIDLIIGDDGEDDKEEIPEDDYIEALDGIYEFIESFDFGSADSIMNMLEKYKVPNEYEIQYNKLKELMANVDRDSILELLSKNVSVN
ncbi:MAG: hybrid sensor histidine kinase/response regulator, partial [Butyrivibrio sp.]|nr:hybrid sensor histidine kinase/response regulator [Butyrivibrio sp.]